MSLHKYILYKYTAHTKKQTICVTLRLIVAEYSYEVPFSEVYQHHYGSDECMNHVMHIYSTAWAAKSAYFHRMPLIYIIFI